jgi:hypothetical protein
MTDLERSALRFGIDLARHVELLKLVADDWRIENWAAKLVTPELDTSNLIPTMRASLRKDFEAATHLSLGAREGMVS